MARPTKYTEQIADKIIAFVAQGLTLKDVAYGLNISWDSINRWRKTHSDFNERLNKATEEQQWNSAAELAKYKYRGYTRRLHKTVAAQPLTSLKSTGIAELEEKYLGFYVRRKPLMEYRPYTPCIVGDSDYLEWLEKLPNGETRHYRCRVWAYLKSRMPKYEIGYVL